MASILALADTQIGVSTVDLDDQRDVLERIVALALERQVELVVHGGDVFEGPVVTPEQMRMFLDATEPLRASKIPVLVLRGNGRHDSAVRPVHALDVLREIDGFVVSDRPDVYRFGDIAVCTLPWVHPGQLIARLNGNIDHDSVNATVARMLVEIAQDLHARARREGCDAVLVAHWAITGSALPSGLNVEEMREPVLPWAELDAIGFDLIVGAHIHEPQRLDVNELDRTPGFVIGSPQHLNHGEKGEHGCWIVDLPDGIESVAIPSRQFVTLDYTADSSVPMPAFPDGAIVRVRLSATEEEARSFDQADARRQLLLAGASRVTFEIDVERTVRRRAEISEQFSVRDAMALYCETTGIEEPLRGRMLEAIDEWSAVE